MKKITAKTLNELYLDGPYHVYIFIFSCKNILTSDFDLQNLSKRRHNVYCANPRP